MHTESPHSPHLFLVEMPAREEVENRFAAFTLPVGSTIKSALQAVVDRYDSLGGGTTSYDRVIELLAGIPEVGLVQDLKNFPRAGVAHKALEKRISDMYERELLADEAQQFSDAVSMHDQEVSAAFAGLEKWVFSSDSDEIGGALRDPWTEVLGALSHPSLEASVIVTCRVERSVFGVKRIPNGMYFYQERDEERHSIGFPIDSVEHILPPGNLDWAGKTLLRAGDQTLYCSKPGAYESGDMSPYGTLILTLPGSENTIAIPLKPTRKSQVDV